MVGGGRGGGRRRVGGGPPPLIKRGTVMIELDTVRRRRGR